MQTDILKEFVDLAETLNYTKTAQRCHIAQPALSKHIVMLERELNVTLFERDRRHVALTEAGSALLPLATSAADSIQAMESLAMEYRRGFRETITVGYLRAAAEASVPNAHQAFKETHPQVDVIYKPYSYYDLIEALDNDEIDIAIGSQPAEPKSDANEIYDSRALFEDELKVVVAETHPLYSQNGNMLKPENLEGETLLALPSNTPFSDLPILTAFLDNHGIKATLLERFNALDTLPMQLATERCIAILPSHLKTHFVEAHMGDFRFLDLDELNQRRIYGIAWKRNSPKRSLVDYADIFAQTFRAS